ncbi:hypothetical protein UFOVP820_9 [uncultured Caudovirales phage]|uniref:Uncharacterized protein n=1 Tax=uncultured Caudovirales phage TaxID=2100421 RepID=A0A6J5P7P5_9CAUD|nr:hypothetical protein UFOVP820_9 [uncultured Caudovirales phage]
MTITSNIVDRMADGRTITAHVTVGRLAGGVPHAIARYTLEGCGLSFPSRYEARVHATMVAPLKKEPA